MAMEENLGPQFADHIKVYRGFKHYPSEPVVNFQGLGTHWTTNEAVAQAFARHQAGGWKQEQYGGSVLEGYIHKDHVLSNDDAEAAGYALAPGESEVPVKPGTPVKLTRMSSFKGEDEGVHTPLRRFNQDFANGVA
jgi:hypothetical protein